MDYSRLYNTKTSVYYMCLFWKVYDFCIKVVDVEWLLSEATATSVFFNVLP